MIKNWRFWTGIGVGVVVALLAVALVSLALAQGPGPGTPPAGRGPGFADEDGDGLCDHYGNGWGMMGTGWSWHQTMLETAAKALGLTPDELTAEFQAGKTLAQVAKERGVELADVQTALLDARKTALDKAVADGSITQEQADWMLDHMQQRLDDDNAGSGMMGRGWGMHSGRGRGGMMGWGYQAPQAQ